MCRISRSRPRSDGCGIMSDRSIRRSRDLPAVAYAHYVLARGRAADIPTLRYFNDTQLARLPTQLAMAQLGAALTQAGDVVSGRARRPPPRWE